MAVSGKIGAVGLATVALALTVTGVVLAATDPNPAGAAKDPLILNGYPPRSAQLHVVISTGQAYNITADLNVNFDTNAVAADVQVPMFFSATHLDLRLVGGHIYATSPNLASVIGSKWFSTPASLPSLFGLSLEMTKPDISLITGFPQSTVTHHGYYTTYKYHRDNVTITAPSGLPFTVPTRAAIDFSITLGRQDELTATSFTVTSATSTASIAVTVLSYNAAATIVAPPARDVTAITPAEIARIFGSTALGNLFAPHSIARLGQIRLS
jgi:hypothetical protein